jgi:hypothetical protein
MTINTAATAAVAAAKPIIATGGQRRCSSAKIKNATCHHIMFMSGKSIGGFF